MSDNFIQLVNTGENSITTFLVMNAPNREHQNEIDLVESSNKSKDKTKLRPIATAASSSVGKIDM